MTIDAARLRELFEHPETATPEEVRTLVRDVRELQATIEIYGDPRLAAALRRPHPGDGGLVPRPLRDREPQRQEEPG